MDPSLPNLKYLVGFQFTLTFHLHVFLQSAFREALVSMRTRLKQSKSALMRWFWLLVYLCVVRCLFVFLSGCRLFHLSKLILLPSVPAAFITMAAECFVQLSSTLYCYLQICPDEHRETKAWITISEIYFFVRTVYFYKQFNY